MTKKTPSIILTLGALIFLSLYLTQMGNAFWHDELPATNFFHKYDPLTPSPEGYNPKGMMDFSKNWRHYLRIYPPGFITFFKFWSYLSHNNAYIMRIPLLLLCLLSLFRFFKTLSLFVSKVESSLYTTFIGFSPLWLGQGIRLNPESFTLCFSIISLSFFIQNLQQVGKKEETQSLNFFAAINTLWLLFDYFALFPHIIQCTCLFFFKKELLKKRLVIPSIAVILLYLLTFSLTMGIEAANPFTFKWARPEWINLFKIFQFLSVGKIYE